MNEKAKLKETIKLLEEKLELLDTRLERVKNEDEIFNKLITMSKSIISIQDLLLLHISVHKEKNVEDVQYLNYYQ